MTTDNIFPADDDIQKNLLQVRARIQHACDRFNRDAAQVSLLAVSKTKPGSMIESALRLGQVDFGENYLQEALEKITASRYWETNKKGDQDSQPAPLNKPVWHYIGAIQSNKTRQIAEHFDWVHTVSSSKIARRLSEQRPSHLSPLDIMLQVNIDSEPTKSGIKDNELHDLINLMLPLTGIRLRGLMTIPAPSSDIEAQRQPFAKLRELKEQCISHFQDDLKYFDQLSMGMTGDLEAAVAEGATWLRIGTAIFGAREQPRPG